MIQKLRYNNLFNYFLLMLVLSPFNAIILYQFTPSIIVLYYKLISILIVISSIYIFLFKNINIKFNSVMIYGFLYAIYISISIFNNNIGYTQILSAIAAIGIIAITRVYTLDENLVRKIIFFFKITIVLSFIVSLYKVFNPSFMIPFEKSFLKIGNIYQNRRPSIFGYVGLHDLALSLLPIGAILISYNQIQNKNNFGWILLLGIISVLSNSRYIMVGFMILLIQNFTFRNSFVKVFRNTGIILVISICILFALDFLGYSINDYFETRLFHEGGFVYTTRYLAWQAFLEFFPENPLYGTGQHLTYDIQDFLGGRSSQIHVGYLSHLVHYGVIGSFLLFGFWIKILMMFFKTYRLTKFSGSFYGFLIFLWSIATFVSYSIITYGILFLFVFNTYYLKDYYEKNSIHS